MGMACFPERLAFLLRASFVLFLVVLVMDEV